MNHKTNRSQKNQQPVIEDLVVNEAHAAEAKDKTILVFGALGKKELYFILIKRPHLFMLPFGKLNTSSRFDFQPKHSIQAYWRCRLTAHFKYPDFFEKFFVRHCSRKDFPNSNFVLTKGSDRVKRLGPSQIATLRMNANYAPKVNVN